MKRIDNLVQESLEREREYYKRFAGMLGRYSKKDNVTMSHQNLRKKEDDYVAFLNKHYPVSS